MSKRDMLQTIARQRGNKNQWIIRKGDQFSNENLHRLPFTVLVSLFLSALWLIIWTCPWIVTLSVCANLATFLSNSAARPLQHSQSNDQDFLATEKKYFSVNKRTVAGKARSLGFVFSSVLVFIDQVSQHSTLFPDLPISNFSFHFSRPNTHSTKSYVWLRERS